MIILGINAYHPDAAVALLRNGELVWAAEEERFSRVKHASGFPEMALRRCLEDAGISATDIDVVAISKDPKAHLSRKILCVLQNKPSMEFIGNRLRAFGKANHFESDFNKVFRDMASSLQAKFVHVEHHHAHMASSFCFSGFKRAACLTVDGLGDFSSAAWGVGEGNSITIKGQVFFPHSLGFLYTAGTQFLGFHHFGDEYKVMGLAAYGKPVYLDVFREMLRFDGDDLFELDLSYFTHQKGQAKVRWQGGVPEQDILFSAKWYERFGTARCPEAALTEREMNMAASLQAVLEEAYFRILCRIGQQTGEKRLCLAGGVAYNSVANGKITQKTPFEEVYIQPAAGDAGTAIGAAMFVYKKHCGNVESRKVMNHVYYGPEFSDERIGAELAASGLVHEKLSDEALFARTAKEISEGKVVGWFQGKMEFGPRALGNRSILGDPRRADMKDILNQRIKNRENFRPFAPAVLAEWAHEYFEMDCAESPFMLKVFPVRADKQQVIPAVTHVDGTARVQTVSREANLKFWNLIHEFEKRTGVPMVLNTSFNESEPIVCTPSDAIQCFQKTQMDVLVIGNHWIEKKV